MTDELDTLIRDAAPVRDAEIRALRLDEAERELRAAILRQPPPLARAARPQRRRGPMRWGVRGWSGIGVAATAAAVVAVTALGGGGERLGTGAERAWAAPALRVANAVPRLLVGEPGWTVVRADEFTVAEGEMTFRNGTRSVDLHWRADDHPSRVVDRASSARELASVDVLGTAATVFLYDGTRDDFTALWEHGRYSLELRVGFSTGADRLTLDEYRAVLASLKEVSVDAWLEAMPASVVLPGQTGTAVDAMLADMTLPPGFDASALRSDRAVRDRYQLGARVAGAVACAWIERWVAARAAGDRAGAAAAVDAMQGSRRWSILREMTAGGAYSQVVWEYADAMKDGSGITAGRPLTVEESYRAALGC